MDVMDLVDALPKDVTASLLAVPSFGRASTKPFKNFIQLVLHFLNGLLSWYLCQKLYHWRVQTCLALFWRNINKVYKVCFCMDSCHVIPLSLYSPNTWNAILDLVHILPKGSMASYSSCHLSAKVKQKSKIRYYFLGWCIGQKCYVESCSPCHIIPKTSTRSIAAFT